MKNIFLRLLILILAISVFLSGMAFPVVAEVTEGNGPTEGYFPKGSFVDDLETGETEGEAPTKWENKGNGSMRVVKEGDNSFVRTARGDDDTSAGTSGNRPHVHVKDALSIPYAEGTGQLVIEAKIRVSTTDYRYMLRVTDEKTNYGPASAGLYDANRDYALFATNYDNKLYGVDGKFGSGHPKFKELTEFAVNTWYPIKCVINLDAKTTQYYVNNTLKGTGAITDNYMTTIENITRVGFSMGCTGGNTTTASTMDFDDVKVYKLQSNPRAELITNDGDTLPANNRIGIKFDKYMYAASLNADTVKLKDKASGREVICSVREYDEESSIYYITPDESLTVGSQYTVELTDRIYADNAYDYYEGGFLLGTMSFDFQAAPEASSNAKLAYLKLDGEDIRDFDPVVDFYEIEIPFTEREHTPVVTAECEDSNAEIEVMQAEGLPGVATVKVTAENKLAVRTYTISMTVGRDLSKIGENLLINPGFEDGKDPWKGQKTFTIDNTATAAEGNFYGLLKGRNYAGSPWAQYTQKIKVEGGRTYLLSARVKLCYSTDDGEKFDMYAGSDHVELPEDGGSQNLERVEVNSDAWYQVISTVVTKQDTEISPTALSWNKDVDYMVDDHFLGELKPTIKYVGKKELSIPVQGSNKLALSANIVNQLGTTNGVKNEKIKCWEIVGEPYGVSISGNELIVQADADPCDIEIEAVMEPKYVGAYTDELRERVTIKLLSNGNKKPQAKELKINGSVELENTLEVSYRFFQEDGKQEGATKVQWYAADSPDSSFSAIPSANGTTFYIDENYVDKIIKVSVLPVAADGEEGDLTMSAYIAKKKAPKAVNVKIDGLSYVGSTLSGSYTYTDINGDAENLNSEGGTTHRWLRATSEDSTFVPIEGATSSTYTLVEDDINCYIMYEVTPVAQNAPYTGEADECPLIAGPTRPTVSNISISYKGGSLYSGNYKYNHSNNIVEGESICKWYVNDIYACDGTTLNASVSKGDVITFEVTPVASLAPCDGESDSGKYIVSGKSSGGGGGGGGSTGGDILPVIPVPKEDTTVTTPEEDTNGTEVIQKHWASEAIEFVTSRGIMENVSENNFDEDKLVDRKDFLKYVLTALGFEGTEYRGEFSDVTETDEIAPLLQTAVDKGIISKDVAFCPDRSVSREEVCKIIVLALSEKTELVSDKETGGLNFRDNDIIAQWAVPYVEDAVNTGILKGVSETEFLPRGQVTRAQTATIIQRIVNYAKLV